MFPDDVISLLARVRDEPLEKTCVYLTVDGLEKLHCDTNSNESELHNVLHCVCNIVNEPKYLCHWMLH